MTQYLTDQWDKAKDEMSVFFAEMDAKIANAQAVVKDAETAARIAALEEQNAELLEALEAINQHGGVTWDYATIGNIARAAIKAANG